MGIFGLVKLGAQRGSGPGRMNPLPLETGWSRAGVSRVRLCGRSPFPTSPEEGLAPKHFLHLILDFRFRLSSGKDDAHS